MPYVPLRRGAGRLFDENLNAMLQELYEPVALESVAATAIADAGSAINTTDKAAGRLVWDTTNNRVMAASGDQATDAWYVADGSASVTPA